VFAASVLAAAVGLAGVSGAAQAQTMTKEQMMKVQQTNMERAKAGHLVACYGVNAAAKNDCSAGAHSCAGQASSARDPKSFVLLPAGTATSSTAVRSDNEPGRWENTEVPVSA
jgi:uncharacterized membrane protein